MLYPNLDTYCDLDDVSSTYTPSCLEKNCNQIFVKGPALTKEIFDKVNAEIVPKKTSFCGKKLKTRRLIYLAGLIVIYLASTFGTIVFWFTDTMEDIVMNQIVLTNESRTFPLWKKPSVKPLYKAYLFNYTNHDSYQNGIDTKLKLQELGPYVYEETVERVNIDFQEDTITYQQKSSYNFRPDLSKGKSSDRIWVPNIPLISGVAISKNMNYFARAGLTALFSALDEQPFLELNVGSYVQGYESTLAKLSSMAEPITDVKAPVKVGLMSEKEGLQPQIYKMNTGRNVTKFGIFETLNGDEYFHQHSSEQCDRVSSTDGALYPPKKVQAKETVRFLFPELCRTFPLKFDKEVTVLKGKVPAYQYVLPEDVYDYSLPENQCYCSTDDGGCPLNGLYNVSKCAFGAPMLASHPHFYKADPKLFEHIDGLNPKGRDYKTRVSLHPRLGFAMTAKTFLQMNLQVQKVYPIHQLDFFDDDIVLPLAWFEVVLDENFLTPDFVDLIYEATFTIARVEQALKYGCLLTSITTSLFIALIVKRIIKERKLNHLNRSREQSGEI